MYYNLSTNVITNVMTCFLVFAATTIRICIRFGTERRLFQKQPVLVRFIFVSKRTRIC